LCMVKKKRLYSAKKINSMETIQKIFETGKNDVFSVLFGTNHDDFNEPGKLEKKFKIDEVLTKKSSYAIVFGAKNRKLGLKKTSTQIVTGYERVAIKGKYFDVFCNVSIAFLCTTDMDYKGEFMSDVDVSGLNPLDMTSAQKIGNYMFRKKFSVLKFDNVCKQVGTIFCCYTNTKAVYYFNVNDMWHERIMIDTGKKGDDGKNIMKEFIVYFIEGLKGMNMIEYFSNWKKRKYDVSYFGDAAVLISCLISGLYVLESLGVVHGSLKYENIIYVNHLIFFSDFNEKRYVLARDHLSLLEPIKKKEIEEKYRKKDTKFVVKLIISLLIQVKLKDEINLEYEFESCKSSGFLLLNKLLFLNEKKRIKKEKDVYVEITSTLLKLFVKLKKDKFKYEKIDLPNLFGEELNAKLRMSSQLRKHIDKNIVGKMRSRKKKYIKKLEIQVKVEKKKVKEGKKKLKEGKKKLKVEKKNVLVEKKNVLVEKKNVLVEKKRAEKAEQRVEEVEQRVEEVEQRFKDEERKNRKEKRKSFLLEREMNLKNLELRNEMYEMKKKMEKVAKNELKQYKKIFKEREKMFLRSEKIQRSVMFATVSEYRFVREIGGINSKKGNNSVVFEVDLEEKRYAMKISLIYKDQDAISRILKTQQTQQILITSVLPEFLKNVPSHKNLCKCYHTFIDVVPVEVLKKISEVEVFENEFVQLKTAFFIMELFSSDLKSYMKGKGHKYEEKEYLNMMLDLLEGVKVLFDLFYVHRDIKPANIFVRKGSGKRDVLVLGDFGCCLDCNAYKVPFQKPFYDSDMGNLKGSPYYMCPELYSALRRGHGHERHFDYSKNDVFAIGISCFKMLSDKDPFGNENLYDKRKQKDYVGLKSKCVSKGVCDLVGRMCAVDDRISIDEAIKEVNNLLK